MIIKMLETDEEFIKLMPLVAAFSLKTNMPVYQYMKEVAESVTNPLYLTQIGIEGEEFKRYLCGHYLNRTDFMITQALSIDDPRNTMFAFKMFEETLYKDGVKKLVMMTHLNPRVFRKIGFKFERFLLTKELI
jgi:hypothetical protein